MNCHGVQGSNIFILCKNLVRSSNFAFIFYGMAKCRCSKQFYCRKLNTKILKQSPVVTTVVSGGRFFDPISIMNSVLSWHNSVWMAFVSFPSNLCQLNSTVNTGRSSSAEKSLGSQVTRYDSRRALIKSGFYSQLVHPLTIQYVVII